MGEHGQRWEDAGIGRLAKFWPVIMVLFSAGAWYQSTCATKEALAQSKAKLDDHEVRLIRVEDAVIYFKDLVAIERDRRKNG